MDRLAIDGGTPLRTRPFPAWPVHGEEERQALAEALGRPPWGGRVVRGEGAVAAFEAEFAAAHAAPAALAVTNGTHALQLALELLGVGPGDEVLLPAHTPLPTSNAVRQCGAVPVPVDVDPSTHCLDPALLEDARTARTAAVIPVHLGGHVADLDLILPWAERAGVAVVQDAAHAHGARWHGRGLGDFGTVATFSFMAHKVMTAGEGGAVLLPDHLDYDDAFARHCLGRSPGGLSANARAAASNYRMNEFTAAVLRAQLARLADQNELRERRWSEFTDLVAAIPGVSPQGRDPRCTTHSHYLPSLVLDPTGDLPRDLVVQALRAEGIPAAPLFPPVYRIPAFRDGPDVAHTDGADDLAARCPHSERLGRCGLFLRHEVLLGEREDVHDVAAALTKVLNGLGTG